MQFCRFFCSKLVGRQMGDLELPSDHLCQNTVLLCVSHCINMLRSKSTVQGYEVLEELSVPCNHKPIDA